MEKRNKKGLVIFGALALSAILTVGIFTLNQNPKLEESPQDNGDIIQIINDVTPGGIDETPKEAAIPDITPSVITPAETEKTDNIIQLTVMPEKPEPPELPDTAYQGEPADEATVEDVEIYEALDPVLKNPDVKPDITIAPVEPAKPQENTPQSGDTNASGQIYIPGFGWVKNEGGGGQGSVSYVDESKLDIIIGN